jgi:hypothetical protein
VQSGEVPVVHVVTLSVTPPSTMAVHVIPAPELLPPELPELEPPESVPPEEPAPDEPPLDELPPDELPPEDEPEPDPLEPEPPELEAVPESSPGPVVDGLLLLLQPVVEVVPARKAPAQIVAIETALIVVSSFLAWFCYCPEGSARQVLMV